MEPRGVELIGVMPLENRGRKECLRRAIFGPPIVPFIDVGVMEFIALDVELIPLHPGMQDIQNIVKDFVEREFWLWPCFGSFQMGIHVAVKVLTSDFGRHVIVNERRGGGCGLCIHRSVLPNEGGRFAS